MSQAICPEWHRNAMSSVLYVGSILSTTRSTCHHHVHDDPCRLSVELTVIDSGEIDAVLQRADRRAVSPGDTPV